MATDITNTNLAVTAIAPGRRPCLQLWVDWDDTGWQADEDLDGNWTDESARIVDARGDMQATDYRRSPGAVGAGVVNVCHVTLRNSDFRYSPSNAAGDLYAAIQNGGIYMKRAVVRAGFHDLTNKVLNPAFTTQGGGGVDEFANWSEVWSDGDLHWHDSIYRSTPASCELVQGASLGTYVYQTIADIVPGFVYTLSFWTRGTGTNPGRYKVRDETNAADIVAVTSTGNGSNTWAEVTETFTAPAGCVSLGVYLYPGATNNYIAYFDDVALTVAEYTRQITGYIVSAQENYRSRTVMLEIRDRGADQARGRMTSGPAGTYPRIYADTEADDYLDGLVDQWDGAGLGVDTIGAVDVCDVGLWVPPYAWVDDDTLWREFQRVAEAQAGRMWWDKDGDLHFDDGAHWVEAHSDSFDDPLTVQATLDIGGFRDTSPVYEYGNRYNAVRAGYTPLRILTAPDTAYGLREVLSVPPGETITHRAQMAWPVYWYGTGSPLAATAYQAVTPGGVDITADVTVDVDYYTERVEFTIENTNTAYTALIVKLELVVDNPFDDEGSDWYETATGAGIDSLTINNGLVQSQEHAAGLADYLLTRFQHPLQVVRVGGVPARPWLEAGDRVALTELDLGIDEEYFLTRVAFQYGNGGFAQTLEALCVADLFPYEDWFIIGTSEYGVGVNIDSGRYFW